MDLQSYSPGLDIRQFKTKVKVKEETKMENIVESLL